MTPLSLGKRKKMYSVQDQGNRVVASMRRWSFRHRIALLTDTISLLSSLHLSSNNPILFFCSQHIIRRWIFLQICRLFIQLCRKNLQGKMHLASNIILTFDYDFFIFFRLSDIGDFLYVLSRLVSESCSEINDSSQVKIQPNF